MSSRDSSPFPPRAAFVGYAPRMSWLEIYAPLGDLDAGLVLLFLVWVATVITGFLLWVRARRGDED